MRAHPPTHTQPKIDGVPSAFRPLFDAVGYHPSMLRVFVELARLAGLATATAAAPDTVMVVLDASQRMADRVVEERSISTIAGEALGETLSAIAAETDAPRIGLRRAGGTPRDGGAEPCTVAELVARPSAPDAALWERAFDGFEPGGPCPLIEAVIAGLHDLDDAPGAQRLVLVTAGGDDCGGSAARVIEAIGARDRPVLIRVVGLALAAPDVDLFAGVPLRNVTRPDQLASTLRWALVEREQPSNDDAEAEPERPAATISAPQEVLVGGSIEIEWTGPEAAEDFVSLAQPGTPGVDYLSWLRIDAGTPLTLAAPKQPGSYQLRYVDGTTGEILARRMIEVNVEEITLTAPAVVDAGRRFEVAWTGTTEAGDYVAVSGVDTPASRMLDWATAAAGSPVTLAAPARPGRYEVRYIRREGMEIVASTPIEVAR
jgi:Ca-activated chloride channel family protein